MESQPAESQPQPTNEGGSEKPENNIEDHEEPEQVDGSQYDPDDDYPEELYGDYPEDDADPAWMGGMRTIPEEPGRSDDQESPDDEPHIERLCGMKLRMETPVATPGNSATTESEIQLEQYRHITATQQYQLMCIRNQLSMLQEELQ
ncbi:hypothetical protein QCA50_019200 [Cerrena zonata]